MALCKMIKIEDKLMYVCSECNEKVRCVRLIPESEGLVSLLGKFVCDKCYFKAEKRLSKQKTIGYTD